MITIPSELDVKVGESFTVEKDDVGRLIFTPDVDLQWAYDVIKAIEEATPEDIKLMNEFDPIIDSPAVGKERLDDESW
ncbi:MAG: hypothetical protein LBM27_05395 [Lactobacillaceae bacterium]|nr:hypothetical protein [Lactobacillaceae bacterium]